MEGGNSFTFLTNEFYILNAGYVHERNKQFQTTSDTSTVATAGATTTSATTDTTATTITTTETTATGTTYAASSDTNSDPISETVQPFQRILYS